MYEGKDEKAVKTCPFYFKSFNSGQGHTSKQMVIMQFEKCFNEIFSPCFRITEKGASGAIWGSAKALKSNTCVQTIIFSHQ